MPTLIEEIQRDAIDRKVSVSDLLRKVKLAAAKLKLGTVEEWVDRELKGYVDSIPDYRKIGAVPTAQTLYHGDQPIHFGDNLDFLRQVSLGEPIASIEHMIAQQSDSFIRPYPAQIVSKLNEANAGTITQAGARFSSGALVKIVDVVRTLVLEWAIELERIGVSEQKTLNAEDQRKVETASTSIFNIQNIGTLVGNLGVGNVSGPIVSAPIAIDRIKSLVLQMGEHNDALLKQGIDEKDLSRLRSALEGEISKAKPDESVLTKLLRELADKLKSAASSVVAQGIISLINQILGFPG